MKKLVISLFKGLGYLLIYLATTYIITIGYIVFVTLSSESSTFDRALDLALDSTIENAMLLTVIAGLVSLFIYFIIFAIRKKSFIKELHLNKINTISILPLTLLGISLNVFTSMLLSLIPLPEELMNDYIEQSSSLYTGSVFVAIFGITIMAPIVEEIVLRGLVYTRFKKGMGCIAAAILSSLLFGILHGQILWIIYATVLGLVFVWIFERFHSILPCILLHFAFNTTSFTLVFVPTDSMILLLVLLAAGVMGMIPCFIWVHKITKGIPTETVKLNELDFESGEQT